MILDTTLLLRTSRLQWQRGTYVTRVTHYMIKRTSVIKLAPCVQRHHPVQKIGQSIVLHAAGGPEWKKFSESFDSQSERQASLSVETSVEIVNMNFSRDFVIIVIKSNFSAIFIKWIHWNLASCQIGLCMFSLIWSAHSTLKSTMGLLSIFLTSYVLSRCVPNVKRWNTWVSNL